MNYKDKYLKYKTKYLQLKGGFFTKEIQDKVLALGENHKKSKVKFPDIIEKCKQRTEYIFHLFTEMRLDDNIRREDNVYVIPEMEYIPGNDLENLKCAMFFLVNTFPYMKQVLEILNLAREDVTFGYLVNSNLLKPSVDQDIISYLQTALDYRLKPKFFSANMELYELLFNFFSNYRTETYETLKSIFDKIIDICVEHRIFEPILQLTKDYKELEKNEVRMINPWVAKFEYISLDDKTYFDEKWVLGWPFYARDLYHSNRIEQYIEGLPFDIREKSIYIVHKGILHFELSHELNPIRYAININFDGENDEFQLNYLFKNLKIESNKLKI
jgi:hypothetical protein